MNDNGRPETTARDVCRAIFRHKGRAGLSFVAAMGSAVLWTMFCPRVYQSEGKLLVRLGRENSALEPTATLGHEQLVSIPPSRENEINSVVEVLNSRGLIEEVVDAVGPAAILRGKMDAEAGQGGAAAAEGPRAWIAGVTSPVAVDFGQCTRWLGWLGLSEQVDDRERAILELGKRLMVAPVPKSDVVRIAYRTGSPQLAQAVVTRLIEAFLQQYVRLQRTAGAREFLAQQAGQLRRDLERDEDELRALQNDTGVIAPESRQKVLVERVGRLEDEWLDTNSELAAAEAAVRDLQAKLTRLPETRVTDRTTGFSNEGTDSMRQQFYALQMAEQAARAKYHDGHPKIAEIRQQVAAAKEILDQEDQIRTRVTMAPAKLREQAEEAILAQEPRLCSLRIKAETLRTQLAEAREQLKAFNEDELRIAKLRREIDIREADYRKYSTSLGEARIDQAMEAQKMSNISIAQPATCSVKPVQPRATVNLLLGLVTGVLGGLGLAVVSQYLDRSFTTPEDVEKKLGLPTLATIPVLKRRQLVLNGRK